MDNNNELVSIIIPVYNVQDYLQECLNSVIEQSYNNLEIICVDDGSKDNSGIICDEFSKKDARVKVIHTSNQGLAMARNSGLDYVTGEYIAFVDSDDVIEKDYILILLTLLKKNDADISGCRCYRNGNDGQYIYPKENNIFDFVSGPEEFMVRFYNNYFVFVPAWGKLYKASIWKDFRFYNRRFVEDAPMIRPIIFKCKKIAWCQKPLYFYRSRETSLMHTVAAPEALFDWIFNDIDFYAENNIGKLKANAQKFLCYKLCEVWSDLTIEQKRIYKKIYKETLVSIWFHRGNTLAQRLKYTVLYFVKIK